MELNNNPNQDIFIDGHNIKDITQQSIEYRNVFKDHYEKLVEHYEKCFFE